MQSKRAAVAVAALFAAIVLVTSCALFGGGALGVYTQESESLLDRDGPGEHRTKTVYSPEMIVFHQDGTVEWKRKNEAYGQVTFTGTWEGEWETVGKQIKFSKKMTGDSYVWTFEESGVYSQTGQFHGQDIRRTFKRIR